MDNCPKGRPRLASLNDWQSAIDLLILAWRMTIQELGRALKRALSHFAGKRFRGRMNAESNNSVEIDHLLKQRMPPGKPGAGTWLFLPAEK